MTKKSEHEDPWYHKGLSFKCTECGKCCMGSPGYVWVDETEMQQIALALKISLEDFKKHYVRQIGARYSLRELPRDAYRCIFLKDQQCQVYEVRPKQCRTYPYWPQILKSRQTWEMEAKVCEGISEEAPLVSLEEIQKKANN